MTDCTVVLYLLYIGWMLLDGGRGGDIRTYRLTNPLGFKSSICYMELKRSPKSKLSYLISPKKLFFPLASLSPTCECWLLIILCLHQELQSSPVVASLARARPPSEEDGLVLSGVKGSLVNCLHLLEEQLIVTTVTTLLPLLQDERENLRTGGFLGDIWGMLEGKTGLKSQILPPKKTIFPNIPPFLFKSLFLWKILSFRGAIFIFWPPLIG